MASKNNGLESVADNREEEIQIEPIHIDTESLKRAVEEKKARVERLQSQDSAKGSTTDERNKKPNYNYKNRRQSSSNGNSNASKQYARQSSTNERSTNGGDNRNAKDRRTSYNRSKNSKQSFDEKPVRLNSKNRSISGAHSQDGGATSGDEKKRNRSSTASNGKFRNKTYSANSNGESFEYDDYELEEPFSDSDEEAERVQQKPSLIIPRGRIRTLSGTIPPTGFSPKFGGPTMCLSCLQFFDLPDLIEAFSEHLLKEHQIVIEEVDLIVDPKRYVEHWRQRFAKQSITDIFPKIVPKEGDELFGKVEYFFEMSERIPEDYSLRQRLAMRRLEEALACQQREREESSLSLPCIFCRYLARGNRSKIIHHLYMIHHLNLGSPDNLVFVQEYIEHLREKMNRNECIYCEKTFSDRNVLMEHMRKRNHREVNPNNNYYDKFYIINYLELGKRWLEVLAEDFEDSMPAFESDDEEEDETWNEWNEDNIDEDQFRVVCLFCNNNQETVPALLSHMDDNHNFDFTKYIQEEKLGIYERSKFINFLRKKNYNSPNKAAHTDSGSPKPVELPKREEWDVEEELVPMFDNDHLLWLLESYLDEKEGKALEELKTEEGEDGSDEEKQHQKRISESKANTIEGVVAEDLPDVSNSFLAEDDFYKTLC